MDFSYRYNLPEELIATRPAEPRDSSRLFVYDTATDTVSLDTFSNLDQYLSPHSLLVLNDTKVVPARAMLKKETGGKIEVLFLVNEWERPGPIPAIVDRKTEVGARLFFEEAKRSLRVVRQEENLFYLEPEFPPEDIFKILAEYGVTPLPKYIKGGDLPEAELREKYQSVFGTSPASVAAPTASLHFTESLLEKLHEKDIQKTFVTLHVGLGTFAPVSEENFANGKLHTELLSISGASVEAIRQARAARRPVVAVGTTAVRTLESCAEEIFPAGKTSDTPTGSSMPANIAPAHAIAGKTQIFIHPPYHFKAVDAMITNFHLPETSLMMLVQAFLEQKHAKRTLVELYEIAIREKFRFYSFGDGMLLL